MKWSEMSMKCKTSAICKVLLSSIVSFRKSFGLWIKMPSIIQLGATFNIQHYPVLHWFHGKSFVKQKLNCFNLLLTQRMTTNEEVRQNFTVNKSLVAI